MDYLVGDGQYRIYPFTVQSGSISFTEWCSLLTLCLAPLIAHIAAGFPSPSYLHARPPKWHERIALYNPTSILWRYIAIADRRVRAKAWDKWDVAGTNALFWTSRGWDGSEEMITLSAPYCTHLPEHARITLFSGEFVKTVIVTLQGTQAIVALGLALSGSRDSSDGFITFMGVDLIFFPLAFIGLVRLFCAFWLTDDFTYSLSRRGQDSIEDAPQPKDGDTRISMDSLLDGGSHEPNMREARFLPTSYWGSRVVRAISLLPIIGLLVMCVLFLVQPGGGKQFTLTAFLVALFYLIFLAATFVICSYYFIRGETSTTIPCLASKAYKIYTGVLIGMAVAVFVSACVQTRRTACGRWTSAPYEAGDFGICSDSKRPDVIRFDFNKYPDFGLATTQPARDLENKTLGEGEFWVRNFTGTCLGTLGSTVVKHASTLELVDLEELEKIVPPNYSL
ncbi:hypothetical protein F5Y04DRAFT_120299 [Hypomontagnella monticulosa]|nr:hypothetical protein F5Y04DRAFT_120299 [Hypomontagnella monticulosa]